MKVAAAFFLVLPLCSVVGFAQSDAHEREIHRQSEANTQYHNNADDYKFKSGPATPAASTGNYHDYRKDTPTPYVPVANTPSPDASPNLPYTDLWFGRVINPPGSLSNAERFAVHKARADAGDHAEIMWVASMCYKGVYSVDGKNTLMYPKNEEMALQYFKLASAWEPYAEYRVGAMKYLGQGTPVDRVEGLRLVQSAAKRGEALALKFLTEQELPQTGPLPATKTLAKTETTR